MNDENKTKTGLIITALVTAFGLVGVAITIICFVIDSKCTSVKNDVLNRLLEMDRRDIEHRNDMSNIQKGFVVLQTSLANTKSTLSEKIGSFKSDLGIVAKATAKMGDGVDEACLLAEDARSRWVYDSVTAELDLAGKARISTIPPTDYIGQDQVATQAYESLAGRTRFATYMTLVKDRGFYSRWIDRVIEETSRLKKFIDAKDELCKKKEISEIEKVHWKVYKKRFESLHRRLSELLALLYSANA